MFWILAVIISVGLCLQSIFLLTMTFKKKTRFHVLLTVSFAAAMFTLVYVFVPIFLIYYIIKATVWIIGNWVILTVFAYRRPVVRLRVYEYSVVVWVCLLVRLFPGIETYIISLVIMTVHGLYICSILHKNAEDEFAIGITSRERRNPFYLRWYKKVEYEEIYVPPSLVGNKDIRETTDWLRKGVVFFAFVHFLGVLELLTFSLGFGTLAICVDLLRIGFFHTVLYFAIKIVN